MIPQHINLDDEGRFTAGKIDGRRVRIFTDKQGRVGCSRKFSRIEAYENSKREFSMRDDESPMVAYLRSRGFPVTENSEIDDNTAALIGNELEALKRK